MPKEAGKPKTLADVLKDISKSYNLHVGSLASIADDVQAVSTGNLAIDNAIGVGGVPLGRSVELFGPPSSGKTTTALQAAAELQHIIINGGDATRGISADDVIVYLDYEHAMDKRYAKALGLDVDHPSFLFTQPDSLEQGANAALALIATGKVRMTIWDSVAAMNPEAALDAEIGQSLPAIQARVMSQFLRTLNSTLHTHNCASLFVNHIMEKMNIGGYQRPGMPPQTTTPGGRALKFYASVRLEYQQIGTVKGKVYDELSKEYIEQVVATNVKVKVVKNKIGPPFKQALVRVRFGRGFDNFWTALQVLIAHKRIVYSTGYFYFNHSPSLVHPDMNVQTTGTHRPYIQGEAAIFTFADQHPEWRGLCIVEATTVIQESDEALDAITPVIEESSDPEEEVAPLSEEDLAPLASTSGGNRVSLYPEPEKPAAD